MGIQDNGEGGTTEEMGEGEGVNGGDEEDTGGELGRKRAGRGETGVLRRALQRKRTTIEIVRQLGLSATQSYVLFRARTETLPGGATVMGVRRVGRWLKGFLEAVGFILSGFRLKRSRGDPIHAPGTFTITTLFFFLLNKRTCLLVQQEDMSSGSTRRGTGS